MQTAVVIRYLLVIRELDEDESGARSIDIAARLQVTKPSVHTMLKTLVKKNYAAANGSIAGSKTAVIEPLCCMTAVLLIL